MTEKEDNYEIEFICPLHNEQNIHHVFFGGLELECGCSIRQIDNKWIFKSKKANSE